MTSMSGDLAAGNLLATGSDIAVILDWEAAHRGDPLRELARAAWSSSLDDERSADALIEGYGADHAAVRAWFPSCGRTVAVLHRGRAA